MRGNKGGGAPWAAWEVRLAGLILQSSSHPKTCVDALWSEVSWEDLDPDEDPRLLFGLTELRFATRNGLWPIASTDRGETLFLVAVHGTAPWLLVEDGEGGWTRYDMSFAEWLYCYLIGEDMAGPNTAAFYPGPVQLRRLPTSATERPEPWSGPDRGM